MGSIQNHDQELGVRKSAEKSMDRTISEFLGQVSMIGNVSEKLRMLHDYVRRLEDEMRKIEAFRNELPLSLLILNDAIVAVKEEALECRRLNAEPVLEQFIPLKKICEEEDEDEKDGILKESENSKEKMNWMSSVQLWNGDLENHEQGAELGIQKRIGDELSAMKACESQSMGIAFGRFEGYNGFPFEVIRKEKEDLALVPELSLRIPGIKSPRDDIIAGALSFRAGSNSRTGSSSTSNDQSSVPRGSQVHQQQSNRKQRRCWSPELHRRFVAALEKLGGSQIATPKQIREHMQVDGLTNDEVKSHLQKYRLHVRRAPDSKASSGQDPSLALGGLGSSQAPKETDSQSGSPQGPLQFGGNSQGTSMTAGDSIEDEDDDKSENDYWKNHHVHSSENHSV